MYIKASFTVEAAFIMPLAMLIFYAVIMLGIELHEKGKSELIEYNKTQIELNPAMIVRTVNLEGLVGGNKDEG